VPLGPKTQRLAQLLEQDIARMLEKQAERVAYHDEIAHEDGAVTFRCAGGTLWCADTEALARLDRSRGRLVWWWHGLGAVASATSRLDPVVTEAQRYAIDDLLQDSVEVSDAEAEVLCRVAAHFAHADGLLRKDDDGGAEASFFALFDSPMRNALAVSTPKTMPAAGAPSRYSVVAPPEPKPSSSVPPPLRTIPPLRLVAASDTGIASIATPEGGPTRERFSPVAEQALAALPRGFTQALVLVTIDVRDAKARFFVQLVALGANGDLAHVDATRALYDATATLLTEEARAGATWKKLVCRLRPSARGASVEVEAQ
jgi:hypothetical protein